MVQTISNIKEVGSVIAKAGAKLFEDNLMFCKSIKDPAYSPAKFI